MTTNMACVYNIVYMGTVNKNNNKWYMLICVKYTYKCLKAIEPLHHPSQKQQYVWST